MARWVGGRLGTAWGGVDLRDPRIVAGLVAGISLVAYCSRLLPGVGFWDTGVFQAAAPTLGLTHPTGFPTYLLLGWLVTHLVPLGDPAFRLNLLSAVCAALAAGALSLVIGRLGARPAVAGAAALSFALLVPVWRTAVRADTHTLHLLFVLGLFLLLLEWRRRGRPTTWLIGTALAYGLAVGNHPLALAAGPALAGFVLMVDPTILRRARVLAGSVEAFLLGAAVYLYVPLRAAADPPVRPDYLPDSWNDFWRYVLGSDFHTGMGFLTAQGPITALNTVSDFLQTLSAGTGLPLAVAILVLALIGLIALARSDPPAALMLGVGGALTLYVALTYVNGDLQRYYFVPLAVAIAFAALGLQVLARWAATVRPLARARALIPALVRSRLATRVALLLWLVPLLLVPRDIGQIPNMSAGCYAETLIGEVKPGAIVISTWSYTTPLWYERFVIGKRPDVEIENGGTDFLAAQLDNLSASGRPVYLVQDAATFERVRSRYETRPIVACGVSVLEVSAPRARIT